MILLGHSLQFHQKAGWFSCRGQAHLQKIENVGGNFAGIGESQKAIPDIAHGRDGEASSDFSSAAAGIKGSDNVNGMRIAAGETAAQRPECRASGEKKKRGTFPGIAILFPHARTLLLNVSEKIDRLNAQN